MRQSHAVLIRTGLLRQVAEPVLGALSAAASQKGTSCAGSLAQDQLGDPPAAQVGSCSQARRTHTHESHPILRPAMRKHAGHLRTAG